MAQPGCERRSTTIRISAGLIPALTLGIGLAIQPSPAAAAQRPVTATLADRTSSSSSSASAERCRAEGFSPVRRQSVVKRGKQWVKDNVPYDQRKCHRTAASSRPADRYRTDCSGFISMAWALNGSYTTADFARDRKGRWYTIAWDDLEPGDAIVAHTDDLQHVVLFVKWEDDDHEELKSYESRGEDLGTVANVRSVSDMNDAGFHPIRLSGIDGD